MIARLLRKGPAVQSVRRGSGTRRRCGLGGPSQTASLRKLFCVPLEARTVLSAVAFIGHGDFASGSNRADVVFPADLDGDGDIDVITASYHDNQIGWSENQDGFGAFVAKPLITAETNGPFSVHAADVDGDGDLDVLSASSRDGIIAWYENTDRLGHFGPRQVITRQTFTARSVFAADLDGDGDVDVLSASQGDDKIAWYENLDGRGGFGPQRAITTRAGGARAVYAADLDGDGDMDVLSASGDILRQVGESKIAWYENLDGGASFGPQQLIASDVAGARSVTAADVDGDGDLDALSLSYYDKSILWHENTDGVGDFGLSRAVGENVNRGSSFETADLDDDGDIDVLAIADGNSAWFENIDGHGSFGRPQTIDDRATGGSALATADFDGDGDIDILRGYDTITWYSNQRIPSPQPQPAIIPLVVGSTLVETQVKAPSSVFAADVDGDGDMDVISANDDENKRLVWYANVDGAVEFGRPVVIARGARPRGSTRINVQASDFDGDGDMDILWTSPSDGTAAWYENINSLGSFGPARVISASTTTGVLPADVDGDGDFDVVVTSADLTAWHENTDGAGSFGPEQVIADTGAIGLLAADMDGDGDIDIVTAAVRQSGWYENLDGSGRFGATRPFASSGGDVTSMSGADFDGDGDLDVLLSQSTTERFRLTWRENTDGNGNLDVRHSIAAGPDGTRTFAASPVDFDDDGDVDVLAVSNRGVEWHENRDGLGNFVERQILMGPRLSDASSAFAADFDGDGDQDLVSAWPNEHKVAWYENIDGSGTFGNQQPIVMTGADDARTVLSADFDGDGDLDVAVASYRSQGVEGKIVWFENRDGSGAFARQRIIADDVGTPGGIAAADVDADGDVDLLWASDRRTVGWFENTDGAGNFTVQREISREFAGARALAAADLDQDGDIDVLAASSRYGPSHLRTDDDVHKVVWFQNTDGQGNYGPEQVITTGVVEPRLVSAADLDGDGDMDVLSASRGEVAIAWYENTDGRATFGPQRVINPHAPAVNSVRTADMDADGDLDVLATFGRDRKAAWYENTDGRGSFGPQQVITISAGDDIFAVDFDTDGDTDILTSISVWYENTGGAEGFVSRELVEFGVGDQRLVHVEDVDGDGDFDLLAASDLDDKVVWYDNLTAGVAPHLAGDANEDGRFDRLDIQQVLESARYRTGEPAAWHEGDWNRDGLFDQLDLIYALANGRFG